MILLAVSALCLALLVPGLDAAVNLDSSLQVRLGSVLELTCTVTPGSSSSSLEVTGYSWELNEQEIRVMEDSRYQTMEDATMGKLTIFDVQYTDAGRYRCTVEYSDGSTERSSERQVMVIIPPVIQAESPVYVEERTTARLTCTTNTTATMRWTFANGTGITSGGRYTVENDGRNFTLVIAMVTSQDAGEYICKAGNVAGSDDFPVVLRPYTPSPPVLVPLPPSVSVAKGESFNLTCRVEHQFPIPKLSWALNGSDVATKLEGNVMVVKTDALTLVVTAATFDPRGTYTCTATNSLGTNTTSTQVVIMGRPDVTVSPSQINVAVGGSVSFSCAAFAVPPVTSLQWITPSGGSLQNIADDGDKYRLDGMTLTVKALSTNDSGVYTCEVNNSIGVSKGNASLMVLELPPAPSNVTKVSAIGQRNVTLQWTEPTDVSANQMIEYFVIKYQLLGNTEEHEAAIVSSKFSMFEVTNLLPGTTHIVWVVSRNAAGDSPGSNTLNVTTKPSAPSISNFTATSLVSGREVLLEWEIEYDGGAVITRYTVEYRRGNSKDWVALNVTTDVYSGRHCVSGLNPETLYMFRLSFHNEHGTSEHMHTQANTLLGVPGKPSPPIVSDPSSTSVTLSFFFTDLGSRVLQGVSTNITQSVTGNTVTQYFTVSAGQTAYQMVLVQVTGLLPNTQYSFKVAGVNAVGTGQFSEESDPVTTGIDNSMYYIIAAGVGGFLLLLLLLCCVAVMVACCCRNQHGAWDTKAASERLAKSSSPVFREPIPSRSDMGLEVSYNPLSWRMNSRLSDHISPFSHDTMPKEPPPYPLPPPLLETDNRFASASTSNLPTQFHSLFELRHAAMERDESEWYLKGCSQPDSVYPRGSDDVPNFLNFSTDV